MFKIEQYDIFEKKIMGPAPTESQVKVAVAGTFTHQNKKITVKGFYNGNQEYIIRFMPEEAGVWQYELTTDKIKEVGEFECIDPSSQNHGPVKVQGMGFKYADGKPFFPFGTTIYAWIHQPQEIIEETLQTLKGNPFNKVRMCIFPKSMIYNTNEPDLFPFCKDDQGKWDVHQPNLIFWQQLEKKLHALNDLGIQADLILLHPYDRWGFAELSREEVLVYLDYCVRRLAAYRNVWWSLANEYDMLFNKNEEDWEFFGEFLFDNDPYHHLLSIHNWIKLYDFSKEWISHCSIQSNTVEDSLRFYDQYQKPIIIDECSYEGDIEPHWGNISGFEMTHRFWKVMTSGGYCTHGETFYREDEVLWWAKGGRLYGKSPTRIAFMKKIMEELGGPLVPDKMQYFINPNEVKEMSETEIAEIIGNSNPIAKAFLALDSIPQYQMSLTNLLYSGYVGNKYFS